MMHHSVAIEYWPIAGNGFTISRETKRDAIVVHVILERDGMRGQGECVPLKRYQYTPEGIKQEIEDWLAQGHEWDRATLQQTLKAGPARFALDTALWQLEAAQTGQPIWQLAGLKENPQNIPTAFTLSGDAPEVMAQQAVAHKDFRWLKIKAMGDGQDEERIKRIHSTVPHIDLLVDANEALTMPDLENLIPICLAHRVVMIEQPLPEGKDDALKGFVSPIPLAADESCHMADDLPGLAEKYQVVNIKLDKSGGLTHALEMVEAARNLGLQIMVGCMASTSLSIAPACLLAPQASYADLDGALLLVRDRDPPLISYRESRVSLLV